MDKLLNKVINGNSLDILKELPSNSIHAIITDPPYELRNFRGEELKWEKDSIALTKEFWDECNRVMIEGGHLISFGANRTIHKFANLMEQSDFEIRDMIIWKYKQSIPKNMDVAKAIDAQILYGKTSTKYLKQVEQEYGGESYQIKGTNNTMFGKKVTFNRKEYSPITDEAKEWDGWGTNLAPSYEPIIVARKKFRGSLAKNVLNNKVGAINVRLLNNEFGKFPSNVIEVDKEQRDSFNTHPTVKPIKLVEILIKLVTKEGQIVLDPFLGSGTTALASAKNNRIYIGIELMEKYCNIANKRLKDFYFIK